MNTGTLTKGSRRTRVVQALLLQAATAVLVVACGGGGYGGDDSPPAPPAPPPPPPAAVARDAQFVDDVVSGLRFSVTGIGEGVTDGAGKFQFVDGRKIDFLAGGATNRITLGSAIPTYTSGALAFSLQDLDEVRAPNGDAYLTNLLRRQRRQYRRLSDRCGREHRDRCRRHRHEIAGFRSQRGRLRR